MLADLGRGEVVGFHRKWTCMKVMGFATGIIKGRV